MVSHNQLKLASASSSRNRAMHRKIVKDAPLQKNEKISPPRVLLQQFPILF